MKNFIADYQPEKFNVLPTIEDADQRLKELCLSDNDFLEIGSIFLRHNVQKSWGLVLLHNHFNVEKDEISLSVLSESSDIEYRTAPAKSIFGSYWPSVLSLVEGKEEILQPLEFSSDAVSKIANEILEVSENFITEFKDYLFTRNLQEVFGLISAKQEISYDETFVELNEINVSVLKVLKSVDAKNFDTIQTSWYFNSNLNETSIGCVVLCQKQQSGAHTPWHNGGRF